MTGAGILVVDIGGSNVKIRHSDNEERRKAPSGPELTPERAVELIRMLMGNWQADCVSIGCPAPAKDNRLILEPVNLGRGWVDFDFGAALGIETRLVNDAVMQAIGSYDGGKMLFLGLGTGLGAALVAGQTALPLEVAHLPYRKGQTFEDWVGKRGFERLGHKRWEAAVHDVVGQLKAALVADYVVLGGGNSKRLRKLPKHARMGNNANAFLGGFRMWQDDIRAL